MNLEEYLWRIDRRTFLRVASLTGIAGIVRPRELIASLIPAELSRVVIVEDETATNGSSINGTTVSLMMDSAIRALTEEYDIGEAWKALFPGIDSSSTIAIKITCINSYMPSHPEVTYAVAEGLKKMSFGGSLFPENNIIIYDRLDEHLESCGYTINTSSNGVRCFGTDNPVAGYSTETYDVNGTTQRLSKIVTEMADYLIDISVLKNLSISGVTLCLKNHYGTCRSPEDMHDNFCDPYIPALNALSLIQGKQCVNICDALFGIYLGGSIPQFAPNKIIMSQDIVAADYWGRKILEDKGCPTIPDAHHIDTAAQAPYSLGTNDPTQMYVMNITNPSTGIGSPDEDVISPQDVLLRQNHPNPFSDHTEVRFYVSRTEGVELTIYDVAGRRVRRLVDRTLGAGWHGITWDGYSDSGERVTSGIYFCRLKTGAYQRAMTMQLVK